MLKILFSTMFCGACEGDLRNKKPLCLLAFLTFTFSVVWSQDYDLENEFNFNVNDYVRFRKSEHWGDYSQISEYLITINSFKVISKSECNDCKVYIIKGLVEQDILTYHNDPKIPTTSTVLYYLPYQDTLYACLSNPSGLDNFLLRKKNMPDLFPRTATPADDEYLETPGTTATISQLTLDNTQVYEGLPSGTLIGTFNQAVELESVCDVPDDNSYFTIANNKLYVRVPLDYHLKSTYNIHVKVNNGKGQIRRKKFIINALVGGGNHAPTDLELSITSMAFNMPFDTKVAEITFSDEDVGDMHTATLVNGPGSNDNVHFKIINGTQLYRQPVGILIGEWDNKLDTVFIRIRVADDKNGVTEKSFKIKLEKGTVCIKPVVTQVTTHSDWYLQAGGVSPSKYVWFAQGKLLGATDIYNPYIYVQDFTINYTAAAYYADGCIAESDPVLPVLPITPPYDGCIDYKVTISDNNNSLKLTAVPSRSGFTVGGNLLVFWQRDGINLPKSDGYSITADQPGNYTVILKFNTCATTASKTVSLSTCPRPVITRNGNTLKSTLGEGFKWYHNDTPLSSVEQSIELAGMGYYSVEVQYPSGCEVRSDPFLINWLGDDCLVPHIIVTSDVNLTTEPATTYRWFINDFWESSSRSIKMEDVGSYFVKAIYQNGCSRISDEFIVDQCSFFPKVVEIDVNGSTLTCKIKNSIVSSYTWYRNDVELPETDSSIMVTESGAYKVKVTYKNSPCTVTSESVVITEISDAQRILTLYPNPTTGKFVISSSISNALPVALYNSMGQLLQSTLWDTRSDYAIDIQNEPPGIYLVCISDDKRRWFMRVMKE